MNPNLWNTAGRDFQLTLSNAFHFFASDETTMFESSISFSSLSLCYHCMMGGVGEVIFQSSSSRFADDFEILRFISDLGRWLDGRVGFKEETDENIIHVWR